MANFDDDHELVCYDCGSVHDPPTTRCGCGGYLETRYETRSSDRQGQEDAEGEGIWKYSDRLPLTADDAVTLGEGSTPLVDCPSVAETEGVDDLLIKDEGQNPTGSLRDREMSVAVSVASERGAEKVELFSTGNSGVSAAAYSGRAGIDTHVCVPNRAHFDAKAMVNVHGGEMTVVRGRLDEARSEAGDENDEHLSLSPFENPYRRDGAKTVGYEIEDQLDARGVDDVVCPVGSGVVFTALDGSLPSDVRLHAVQPEGCAPIVRSYHGDSDEPPRCDDPDTVVGELEVLDPSGGRVVLETLDERGGTAVSVSDGDALDAGLRVARDEGVEVSPAGGLAVAGAVELSERGEFDAGTVVAVNPASGRLFADVFRNRMVYHGK